MAQTAGAGSYGAIDKGAWWWVWLNCVNNNNTTFIFYPAPARAVTLGGADDATLTGSIVLDQAQIELNQKYPTSPIPTTTTPVARATEAIRSITFTQPTGLDTAYGMVSYAITVPVSDSVDTAGSIFPASVFSSNVTFPYLSHANKWFSVNDETNNPHGSALTWSAGQTIKLGMWWNAILAKMQIVRDGVAETMVASDAFDGTLPLTGGNIYIPGNSGNTPSRPFWIKNVRIWRKDKGSAAANNAYLQGVTK